MVSTKMSLGSIIIMQQESSSPKTYDNYTVAVICALSFEMNAIRYVLDREHPRLPAKQGLVASGDLVVKSATKRDLAVLVFGDILCFEMEAAGIATEFSCIVIRGVSDYADSHKNDAWHHYAHERPAVAGLAGSLVASWKGVNHETLYFSTLQPGSLNWSDPAPIPGAGSISTGPTLAPWEMNDLTRVYALWKGRYGDTKGYLAWYDGERWEGPIHLPFVETNVNVSLACRGCEILVSWKDSKTERIKWTRLDKDGNELLEEPQELGRSVESDLGLAVADVNGTIYVAWKGKGGSADVWLTSWLGTENRFRPAQLVPNSEIDRAPSLIGWDNWLVLAWKGVDPERWMWWRHGTVA
jgi:hypothetical protein